MSNFKDYSVLITPQIPSDIKDRFIDGLVKYVDENKGAESPVGLQVRIKATHAGRLTGHNHLYLPAKVKKGLDSFTKPYKKPHLTHHDSKSDPIGRIESASYIETPLPLMAASIYQTLCSDTIDKNTFSAIGKSYKILQDSSFEGLGYASVVSHISDPEAVKKVLDGRYHTVSVGYGTDHLYCSHCFQDWMSADGPCEHQRGKVYSGKKMFLIFGALTYDELSYVNEPADELAQNEEIISRKDSLTRGKLQGKAKLEFLFNGKDTIEDVRRLMSTKQDFYYYDSKTKLHVPLLAELDNNPGEEMTLKELISSDGFYSRLQEFLPKDSKALTADELTALKDEDFVGQNRSFPAIDTNHIQAGRQLLETIEDSDEKSEILSFLETRETILSTTNQEDSTDGKETDAQEGREEVLTTDSADTNSDTTEHMTDSVSYSFNLSASGWGSPEGPNVETEKQILQLLLKLYATAPEDAMDSVSFILDNAGKDDTSLFTNITDKYQLGKAKDEKIAELEAAVVNQRKEYKLLQDSLRVAHTSLNDLNNQLKDSVIEKILAYKQKEDPSKDMAEQKAFFSDKSASELNSILQSLTALFGNSEAVITTDTIEDPTMKIEKSYTDEELEKQHAAILRQATVIRQKAGDPAYRNYLAHQNAKLQALESKLDKTIK